MDIREPYRNDIRHVLGAETMRKRERAILSEEEREAFIEVAYEALPYHRTLALLMFHTGCGIAEAIEVTIGDWDISGDAVLLGNEERRRSVPVPKDVIAIIDAVHGLARRQSQEKGLGERLWPVDRATAHRWIQGLMKKAGIEQRKVSALRYTTLYLWAEQSVPVKTIHGWIGGTDLAHTEGLIKGTMHGGSKRPVKAQRHS